ncbi:putative porin [Salegentibacter flavus]|uniref:Putative porin n=1 Tax=Salegentibacter flavus TaxID=287099 RepID=A0A1I5ALC6_9FLAO|nr:putative porin [Salegentibacter flavus]SFN63243.1 Putative porin [Salegentibacter flavus]
MKNLLLLLIFIPSLVIAQDRLPTRDQQGGQQQTQTDSLAKAPIEDYRIISVESDTTFVDTTLNIHKDYKFNYRRKDNFELLSFPNTGQTYNSLSLRRETDKLMPGFVAGARHFGFMEVEDIYYYRVPTPLTELYFKTVPEQGQQLDAFFTINTSDRLNFSIAHKGVRALGKYQHQLTSTGMFRTTLNYQTLNRKYQLKSHFVSHKLMNQENGGFNPQAMEQYINKEEEFEDRSLLEMNFENAQSTLYGKRFYLDHLYHLAEPRPDNTSALTFGHIFNFDYKKFQFEQANAMNNIFGESFDSANLNDVVRLEELTNEAYARFTNEVLGDLKAKASITTYNYGYNTVYYTTEGRIDNRLKGTNYAAGGEYENSLGGFSVKADAMLSFGGDFNSNYLNTSAAYAFNEENEIEFGFNQNSRLPDYNFMLYQSNYLNYNWQTDFDNVNTQQLYFKSKSKKLVDIDAEITQVQNFTYFGLNEEGMVKPFQHDDQLRYFKLKAYRGFDLGVFGLDNTIMYQNVLDGTSVLKVPAFVTRNSAYYQDHWFRRALFLQTGFTFKYFSEYEANAYDPVLAEFYVQNQKEIGNYPVVDFFFNGKIDQTRIFFKLENVNSLIDGNNNFVAPGYPYTDFLIRFGLVWNFFM